LIVFLSCSISRHYVKAYILISWLVYYN